MDSKILGSRYRIIKALSKGGFGTTYLAEDTQFPDNMQCVVKKLHSSVENEEFLKISRRLFDKEAKTLAKLGKHDQIPQLLAYFEEEQEFYLVQEYVAGKTLANELIIGQSWSETRAIDFLKDLLGIIDCVHNNGVIHRDIKPDNLIRRDQDNKIVLVDFGAVKEVIKAQTEAIALTVSIGTQGYMPTEQARGKPRLASDIYAVGMIAIQALTGSHPLQLPEDENGEILWENQAKCTPQLAQILSKMVRYHFKERYQSAKEILTNLSILENNIASKIDSDITGIISQTASSNSKSGSSSVALVNKSINSDKNSNLFKPIGLALGGLVLAISLIFGSQFLLGKNRNSPSVAELKLATEKAQTGEYAEAIALAQDLSPTPEIQKQIDQWSEQLLDRAEVKYTRNGELETASMIIEQIIPDTSPVKKTGQELLKGWQKEHEFNQSILTIAKEELQKEQWQNAKQEAARIKGTTKYWQTQAAKISNAANLGTESQPGVVDLCSKALDLCN